VPEQPLEPLQSAEHWSDERQAAPAASLGMQTLPSQYVSPLQLRTQASPTPGNGSHTPAVDPPHELDSQICVAVQAPPPGTSALQTFSFQSQ
jgi:hypothetical protein